MVSSTSSSFRKYLETVSGISSLPAPERLIVTVKLSALITSSKEEISLPKGPSTAGFLLSLFAARPNQDVSIPTTTTAATSNTPTMERISGRSHFFLSPFSFVFLFFFVLPCTSASEKSFLISPTLLGERSTGSAMT